MKIINWIAYLFYKFFLKCGKDDWDARHTAKLFTGVFVGFILIVKKRTIILVADLAEGVRLILAVILIKF